MSTRLAFVTAIICSFMMCAGPSELRERSGWLGTGALSRLQLLDALQSEWGCSAEWASLLQCVELLH